MFNLNSKTGLRIDLLFDFPIAATELAKDAEKKKIQSQTFTIASGKDLLRLKEIALAARSSARDTQDIEFLKNHQKKPKG